MSDLLKRTKKSCLKLLRRISTSKQLFVQRLDEDDEYEQEMALEVEQKARQQLEYISCSYTATNVKQSTCHNNHPEPSVQSFENACDTAEDQKEKEQQEPRQELEQQVHDEQEDRESHEHPLEPTKLDVQFARMQYKENVRYLRHTPSNSSLDLQMEPLKPQQQAKDTPKRPLRNASRDMLRDVSPASTSRPCSVSFGTNFDGHYLNVIITEQPPTDDYPIVKWDINGNSLDEVQHFDLTQPWDAFDNRWRQLQTMQSQARRLGSAHSQSQRSNSHYSSSCTLETWIDDAEPGLCDDSQNLLRCNHNSNNCNQCLKSF